MHHAARRFVCRLSIFFVSQSDVTSFLAFLITHYLCWQPLLDLWNLYSIVKIQKRNISLTYFNSFLTFWIIYLSEWSCWAALILWCHQCFVHLWTQLNICSDIIATYYLVILWLLCSCLIGIDMDRVESKGLFGCLFSVECDCSGLHTPVPAWSAGRISGLKCLVPSAVRRNRSGTQSAADMRDQEKRVWDTGVHGKAAEPSGTAGQQRPVLRNPTSHEQ